MTLSKRRFIISLLLCLPVGAASLTTPGIENFHQISDQVYRGAQPTAEGFDTLHKLGIKVVIDLREHDARAINEERLVTAAGMRYVNVPMTGMTPPTASEIKQILGILEDASAGPAFVHCKRGADRTGAVIAAYRVDHDKWDNARALSEAMADKMSSFQFQRKAYIKSFHSIASDAAPATSAVAAPAVTSEAKN